MPRAILFVRLELHLFFKSLRKVTISLLSIILLDSSLSEDIHDGGVGIP